MTSGFYHAGMENKSTPITVTTADLTGLNAIVYPAGGRDLWAALAGGPNARRRQAVMAAVGLGKLPQSKCGYHAVEKALCEALGLNNANSQTISRAIKAAVGPLVGGEIVEVYQKPLTDEDYEGRAVLVGCLTDDDARELGLERWEVCFTVNDTNNQTVSRLVHPRNRAR